MNVGQTRLFVSLFLAVCFGIPVIQAVQEIRQEGRIQFFEILTDTFITPVKRARTMAASIDSAKALIAELESNLKDRDPQSADLRRAEAPAENLLFLAGDLVKAESEVNRYVRKAAPATVEKWRNAAERLFETVSDRNLEDIPVRFEAVKKSLAAVAPGYTSPGLWDGAALAFRHFFLYTVFNQAYLRPYEKTIEETSWAANALRPQMQLARFLLFNDLGEKALAGSGGWYFYKPGVDYLVRPPVDDPRSRVVDPNDRPLVDDPFQAILGFKNQLQEKGIDLLVVVIPGKPSIYPERLFPGFPEHLVEKLGHSRTALEKLKKMGIETVDLFSPFLKEKKMDAEAGEALYLAKDTHWRQRGAKLAATTVAERIRRYPWFEENRLETPYRTDTVEVDREGDVVVMTGLHGISLRQAALRFAPERTTAYQVYRVLQNPDGSPGKSVLYRDDFSTSRILVLGDSFSRIYQTDPPRSAGWIAHLAKELSEPLASIVSDGGASTLVRQKLARKSNVLRGKNLVVWAFVERDFRFGAEGWQTVEMP